MRAHNPVAGALPLVARFLSPRYLRYFWLIGDQAIFAASNFVLNILFARWLTLKDYGLFSVSFSGFIFLSVVHWGAFLEPLLVQSAKIDDAKQHSYVMTLMRVHLAMLLLAVMLSLGAFIVARDLGDTDAGFVIVGAVSCGTAILVLLTARRLCLVFLSAQTSALTGVMYFIGVVGTGYILHRMSFGWFSLWAAMGVWSVVCAGIIFGLLYTHTTGREPFTTRDLFHGQKHYVRWSLLAAVCTWLRSDGVIILLARLSGLEAVAQTRAVLNLGSPFVQILNALQATWLIDSSASHRSGGKHRWNLILPYCLLVGATVGGIFLISSGLFRVAYGGHYDSVAWELPWYYFGVGALGLDLMISSAFKAHGYLRQGYAPQIVAGVISMLLAIIFVPRIGQVGSMHAIVDTHVACMVLAVGMLLWRRRQQ